MSRECERLHHLFHAVKRHRFPFNEMEIPLNGIYVLFEKGEEGHDGDRIVRVGTHTGVNQLRSRLKQHFLNENKDRSIFRKNIGRAILTKNNDSFITYWEYDLTTKLNREKYGNSVDKAKQTEVEKQVSAFIQENFSFIAFEVEQTAIRLNLEAMIISIVSLCDECKPSVTWLGNCSPKEKIRRGGLWLVNELWKTNAKQFDFKTLEYYLGIK